MNPCGRFSFCVAQDGDRERAEVLGQVERPLVPVLHLGDEGGGEREHSGAASDRFSDRSCFWILVWNYASAFVRFGIHVGAFFFLFVFLLRSASYLKSQTLVRRPCLPLAGVGMSYRHNALSHPLPASPPPPPSRTAC